MLTNNPFEEAFGRTAPPPPPPPPPQQQQPQQPSTPPPTVASAESMSAAASSGTGTTAAPGPQPALQAHSAAAQPAHAAAAAAVFAESAPTPSASAPAADERCVLAKFRVDAPFKGREVLRPITYFPICTEVLVNNDGHFTVPDTPRGPHFAHVDSGVRRNEWTRGSYSVAERRYSEALDLRELLTLQFPTLIIPPLPLKSGMRDVETYFGAGDAMQTQRHDLQLFLREIAAMPEVIFFSEWVPPFFLDPRDSFETGTLARMRAALKEMRTVTAFLSELSQRRRGFTEEAAIKVASTSTKLVRSIAGFFFNDSASVADSRGAPASSAPATDWSTLPPAASADACAWERTAGILVSRQKALKKAAKAFEVFLAAQNSKASEQGRAGEAMRLYEGVLHSADSFAKLSEDYHLAALMLEEAANKEKEFTDGKYLNVCMRLAFESNFIGAVLDTIDRVLCLYRAAVQNIYDARDPARSAWLAYAAAVSHGLQTDYMHRYKRYYTRRMRNLILEQIGRPSVEMAAAVSNTIASSPFIALIQDPSFTSYGADGHA